MGKPKETETGRGIKRARDSKQLIKIIDSIIINNNYSEVLLGAIIHRPDAPHSRVEHIFPLTLFQHFKFDNLVNCCDYVTRMPWKDSPNAEKLHKLAYKRLSKADIEKLAMEGKYITIG